MIVLVLNIASTLYMTGLICFVQIVHYPLHAKVGPNHFAEYQAFHMNWTSWVVIPPMLLELATTILLCAQPIKNIHLNYFYALAFLLFVIWVSTGLVQAPTHGKLLSEFNLDLHRKLVLSNWVRTVAWSIRSMVLMYIMWKLLEN